MTDRHSHPTAAHEPRVAAPASPGPAARRALRRRVCTAATVALGSALAGAAGTAHHLAGAEPSPTPAAAAGVAAPPATAFSLSLHSEDRRAATAGGGARLERVRTVQLAWRSR